MLIDPIHFFNERGHSVLSADHLHGELQRLRDENEELERRCRSLAMRLAVLAGEDEAEPVISG
jgi:hypothetical protein